MDMIVEWKLARKRKRNKMKKKLIIAAGTCCIVLVTHWALRSWTPSHAKIRTSLPPHSFYSFALTESDGRIPCLQAEIEGISFLAKLDMGYDGVLSLPKHLLEQLTHKSDAGTVLFTSIRGKKYETSVFTIPKLYIEDVALVNLPVEETHLEFERDTELNPNTNFESSDVTARFGWQAFLGTVILIDLQKSVVICCDNLETLKEKGYPLEQFVATNFLPREELIEFEADVNHRIVKCILDTGCTLNLIHADSNVSDVIEEEPKFANINFANPLPSTAFSVGGRQLGPCTFYETQLPFGVEAIIGVDFLETQIVCIDFINRALLLCPAAEDDSSDSHATPPAL